MSKLKNSKSDRVSYLESTSAIPTSTIMYALWLEIFVRQGGKISHSYSANYAQVGYVFNEHNIPVQDKTIAYDNIGWSRWTPTVEGDRIPENYGSYALDLMILPDVVNQDFTFATDDWRNGWEYGHTRVKTLTRRNNSFLGLHAETNQSLILTYADVELIRKSFNIQASDSLESFVERMNLQHGALLPAFKQLT